MKKIFETTKSILIALIVAILIRSLFFEPFSIPSGSMKPNFVEGDYLFVSKYYYGISKHSFPFSPPIFKGRKFQLHKPKRGDVVVFRIPTDPNIYYIKRIIGIPGDEIQLINGRVELNGQKLDYKADKDFIDNGRNINSYYETLPTGISYRILDETPYFYLDNTQKYKVPENKFFMMGDNRDLSIDSRVIGGPVGFVDEEYIVGKAEFILFSNKESIFRIWDWILSFDLNRFFVKVHP